MTSHYQILDKHYTITALCVGKHPDLSTWGGKQPLEGWRASMTTLSDNWNHLSAYVIWNIKILLLDIFHIGPGISPRLPYHARQRSWRLIPGTIWKISCHNLFITYFTLTFSKHWLLYCKKDLWTDKLRK
jgi:hypothetical protein